MVRFRTRFGTIIKYRFDPYRLLFIIGDSVKDIDTICTKIYTDIDSMIGKFLTVRNTEKSRDELKAQVTNYLQKVLAEGVIYQMPEVRLVYPGPNVVNITLCDQESGEKIESLDQIVTPLAKYSNPDDGGVLGF